MLVSSCTVGWSALGRRRVVLGATRLLLVLLFQTSSAALSGNAWSLQGSLHAQQASLSCMDGDGNAVDWWLILKAPSGTRYGYIDAVTAKEAPAADPCTDQGKTASGWYAAEGEVTAPDSGWRASPNLNSIRSPLSRTLLPLYPAPNLSRCSCCARKSGSLSS